MASSVCVYDKVIRINAQDMLFLLRGVIPGTFYRLLTDILKLGVTPQMASLGGESLKDTHLEK